MPYLAALGGSRHDRESGVPVSDCDLEGPAVWILAAGSNCCKAARAAPGLAGGSGLFVRSGRLGKTPQVRSTSGAWGCPVVIQPYTALCRGEGFNRRSV